MATEAEELAQILAGINSIDRHLEKLNQSVAENSKAIGKHEVAIAVLCEQMKASSSNWGSVRSITLDVIKLLIAAVVGGLLAGQV